MHLHIRFDSAEIINGTRENEGAAVEEGISKVKSLQMKISKYALALTSFLFAATTAYAQLGVYGTVTVRRMTDIPYTQGTTTRTDGGFDPVGGMGGIFYNFKTYGPVRLGLDVRGSIVNSTQGAYTAYNAGGGHIANGLGGVRAAFHTPLLGLKPYVQGSVGVARTNFGTQYNDMLADGTLAKNTGIQYTTHLEYDVFAGVDYAILPIMDFRVVELGYGAIQGNSHTYPVQSLSTGLVFHLPFIK